MHLLAIFLVLCFILEISANVQLNEARRIPGDVVEGVVKDRINRWIKGQNPDANGGVVPEAAERHAKEFEKREKELKQRREKREKEAKATEARKRANKPKQKVPKFPRALRK